jgi:hypothetical protein
LTIRFFIVTAIVLAVILAMGKIKIVFATPEKIMPAVATGVLVHVVYLGGIFYAIAKGLHPAISGVIAIIQPLTAFIVLWVLQTEKPKFRQCFGMVLGIGMLFANFMLATQGQSIAGASELVLINCVSMAAMAIGTIWARRRGLTGNNELLLFTSFWQFLSAACVMALATFALAAVGVGGFKFVINWSTSFVFPVSTYGTKLGL